MTRTLPAWLFLLAAAQVSPQSTATSGARLLYPPDHVQLAGPLRVMAATAKDAAAPTATLDGQPLALTRLLFDAHWRLPGKLKETAKLVGDRSAAALWVATVALEPGPHTLVVAGQRRDLRGADAATTTAAQRFHSHSLVGADAGQLDCAGCHDQPNGALGAVPTPPACAPCHDEDSVQLVHRHVSPPLARCALCHDPHGTTRPKMLVDEKQVLCSRCHEAGHSRT